MVLLGSISLFIALFEWAKGSPVRPSSKTQHGKYDLYSKASTSLSTNRSVIEAGRQPDLGNGKELMMNSQSSVDAMTRVHTSPSSSSVSADVRPKRGRRPKLNPTAKELKRRGYALASYERKKLRKAGLVVEAQRLPSGRPKLQDGAPPEILQVRQIRNEVRAQYFERKRAVREGRLDPAMLKRGRRKKVNAASVDTAAISTATTSTVPSLTTFLARHNRATFESKVAKAQEVVDKAKKARDSGRLPGKQVRPEAPDPDGMTEEEAEKILQKERDRKMKNVARVRKWRQNRRMETVAMKAKKGVEDDPMLQDGVDLDLNRTPPHPTSPSIDLNSSPRSY